jgi:hypothetical protein
MTYIRKLNEINPHIESVKQEIYWQFAVEIITRLAKQYLIQIIVGLTPSICHFVILLVQEERRALEVHVCS